MQSGAQFRARMRQISASSVPFAPAHLLPPTARTPPLPMNALLSALQNSLRGLAAAWRRERAIRQELVVLLLAVPAAFLLSGQLWVRIALIASVLLVLAVECLNTAIEKLCDHLHPGRHDAIGFIKDMGSAAVLCVTLIAALVWAGALVVALYP